jgi:hypothetical protein
MIPDETLARERATLDHERHLRDQNTLRRIATALLPLLQAYTAHDQILLPGGNPPRIDRVRRQHRRAAWRRRTFYLDGTVYGRYDRSEEIYDLSFAFAEMPDRFRLEADLAKALPGLRGKWSVEEDG